MKLFISYAAEQAKEAQQIDLALRQDGHEVFLDRRSLSEGRQFTSQIRREILSSQGLVFLISPASVRHGRYTLSELEIAKLRWPDPSGHILPVLVEDTDLTQIDSYLTDGVTILKPRGKIAVEVAAAVSNFSDSRIDQARKMIAKGNHSKALVLLESVLSDAPESPRANLHAAVACLGGRNPRILDRSTVSSTERFIDQALANDETRLDALRLMAILKYEYYLRLSIRQEPPSFDEVIEELRAKTDAQCDRDLFEQVEFDERLRQVILPPSEDKEVPR